MNTYEQPMLALILGVGISVVGGYCFIGLRALYRRHIAKMKAPLESEIKRLRSESIVLRNVACSTAQQMLDMRTNHARAIQQIHYEYRRPIPRIADPGEVINFRRRVH